MGGEIAVILVQAVKQLVKMSRTKLTDNRQGTISNESTSKSFLPLPKVVGRCG